MGVEIAKNDLRRGVSLETARKKESPEHFSNYILFKAYIWGFCDIAERTGRATELHRVPTTRSCRFGDYFLASSFGLVGRTIVAMHPRQVVYAVSNTQKSNHQTDMNEWSGHSVYAEFTPADLQTEMLRFIARETCGVSCTNKI